MFTPICYLCSQRECAIWWRRSISKSFPRILRKLWIQSCSHGLVWWLQQHVLQRHWRSPEQLQQGNPPLPLSCHLLGWIFYSGAEKKEHPPKLKRNTNHEYRLIFNNVHPLLLFMQSMRTYYMVEAIKYPNISHDSPQTIDSEHNLKITSYDRINQS